VANFENEMRAQLELAQKLIMRPTKTKQPHRESANNEGE
jgi:hypothetical protein